VARTARTASAGGAPAADAREPAAADCDLHSAPPRLPTRTHLISARAATREPKETKEMRRPPSLLAYSRPKGCRAARPDAVDIGSSSSNRHVSRTKFAARFSCRASVPPAEGRTGVNIESCLVCGNTNSMRRVVMAFAAPQSLRAEALLRAELARLARSLPDMPRAARTAVQTVLVSLTSDAGLDPALVAEARLLLNVLLERPAPQHARQRISLRATRLRAA
jgi:hypothetical protein